ncbi:MAG: T9SS type A sorting domain-containing protein [Marinoscillum sp.]
MKLIYLSIICYGLMSAASGQSIHAVTVAINQPDPCEVLKSDLSSIKIYPNPVSAFLTIENLPDEYKITLFNAIGQKLIPVMNQFSGGKINVEGMPEGVYFLHIMTREGVRLHKIKIQKP